MVEIFDDIRKIYRFRAPRAELAHLIEFISESSSDATARLAAGRSFTVKMFPSWTPTFWINLGCAYHIEMGGRYHPIDEPDDILVLRNANVVRHNQPSDHIFTVKFFPGALEAILGISQTGLIDKITDLKTILPPALIRDIRAARSFEQRVDLIQDFLLGRYERRRQKDFYLRFVRDTIGVYEAGGLLYNTSEVAERMFVSSRTINRYFNNIMGIPPKGYFSILRARTALTACLADRFSFDPCDYGYHDMSHFYKAARKFTGRKLSDFYLSRDLPAE